MDTTYATTTTFERKSDATFIHHGRTVLATVQHYGIVIDGVEAVHSIRTCLRYGDKARPTACRPPLSAQNMIFDGLDKPQVLRALRTAPKFALVFNADHSGTRINVY